jgi:hypothetical protein
MKKAQTEFLKAVAAVLDPDCVPGRLVTAIIECWATNMGWDPEQAAAWLRDLAGPMPPCAAVDGEPGGEVGDEVAIVIVDEAEPVDEAELSPEARAGYERIMSIVYEANAAPPGTTLQ